MHTLKNGVQSKTEKNVLLTQLSEVEISSGYGGLGVQAAKTP